MTNDPDETMEPVSVLHGHRGQGDGDVTSRNILFESDTDPELRLSDDKRRQLQADDADAISASIILIAHPNKLLYGNRYDLNPGSALLIGRSEEADVSLEEVQTISRMHARIEHQGSRLVIEDLDSTNGTLVNDRYIHEPVTLQNGDRFQVGEVHFKLLHDRDVEHAYHLTISDLVSHDGLTGAVNKRKFDEAFAQEFARAKRYHRPLSLIVLDIDHFKAINDHHGHLCGDFVLQEVSRRISNRIRAEQLFARIGGEEFAIICPETTALGAGTVAEDLRQAIADAPVHFRDKGISVRCSFGIAEMTETTRDSSKLFEAADRALYQSKRGGRNMVSWFREQD